MVGSWLNEGHICVHGDDEYLTFVGLVPLARIVDFVTDNEFD